MSKLILLSPDQKLIREVGKDSVTESNNCNIRQKSKLNSTMIYSRHAIIKNIQTVFQTYNYNNNIQLKIEII
jgi:hypothetical protein